MLALDPRRGAREVEHEEGRRRDVGRLDVEPDEHVTARRASIQAFTRLAAKIVCGEPVRVIAA